ncbi:hypothetical protein RDABS01_025021 [Bienertia sinuspersici]
MGEIGGNDFNGPFQQGKTIPQVTQLVPGVVKTIKDAVEEVISLGATNIVVPGNFPIGCVPIIMPSQVTTINNCYKPFNNCNKSTPMWPLSMGTTTRL